MTERDERRSLIEWSTDQVYIWAANEYAVHYDVQHMHNSGLGDEEIAEFIANEIRSFARRGSGGAQWLLEHVFEDITGVEYDDIDWSGIIDTLTDRKVNA